jgi:hypothetical protein
MKGFPAGWLWNGLWEGWLWLSMQPLPVRAQPTLFSAGGRKYGLVPHALSAVEPPVEAAGTEVREESN